MKKLLFLLIFVLVLSYTASAAITDSSGNASLELSQDSVVISGLTLRAVPGDLQTISFTIKNTGTLGFDKS